MVSRRFWFALLATIGLSLSVKAAEKPTLEVRMKSVEAALTKFEYFAGLVGKEEEGKQLTGLAKAFTNAKGLEGVDTTKDFGLYATMTANVVDSPVVLLVPVKDEEAFLGLLTGKLSLDPKKGANGVYSLEVPNVPQTVYFTFGDNYAHITFGNVKNLDAKSRLAPKEFFVGEASALLSVQMHLERMPDEVKKIVFGQFELKMAEEKAKKDPNETPAQVKFKSLLLDGISAMVKSVFDDGKSLGMSIVIDPSTDDLGVKLALTAKPGSALDQAFQSNAKRGSASLASVGNVENAAVAVGLNMAVPESFKGRLTDVVDALNTEVVNSAKPEEKAIAKQMMDALAPSLKAGVLDLTVVVTMSKETGKLQASAAVKTVKAKEIESVVKTVAPFAPKDKVTITLDAGTVGPATQHTVQIVDGAPVMEKTFGTAIINLAVSDDLVAMTIGRNESRLKTMFDSKATTAPSLQITTAFAAISPIAEDRLPKEKVLGFVKDIFGETPTPGADQGTITAKAGADGLNVNFSLKGKAFKLLYLVGEESKK